MPVVKGGVWTNIEDEILKASVSKYGLNQWARVSSLLARKTPKQCKARWNEWLDPSIRKIEWSKDEDEKLLHLAKLMPTQWRTIAPIVGRTANQCLERYQKLLDEAEQKESGALGLTGSGGEARAPTADSVRRLRPGEIDPDPETKPAKADTVDLDEDEKEMLSEARARLANTQGKKAKRKARERQQEESRRLAALQKRRELKTSGINIKVTTRKAGQMDYNADIPFEQKPVPGFYDTSEEHQRNLREHAAFDPKKVQLATKRKGDQDEDPDRKRRKNDKEDASLQAALKAGRMQKMREAEQSSKRRSLVLPAPQISEGELEDIVKMGMLGERASEMARESDNTATKGLVGSYSQLNSGAPIRTPLAPAQEDHIANEIRNIRALTETQSSLLGGENTPLHEGSASTGFDGVAPRKQVTSTPNPLATPLRSGMAGMTPGGPGMTPRAPGQTPLRTPRDGFALNSVGDEVAARQKLLKGLSALPKPKETEWDLELPEEQMEVDSMEKQEEDAAERDRRERDRREAEEELERRRRTQAVQRSLPRPAAVDVSHLLKCADELEDPAAAMVAREVAILMANDAAKFPAPGSRPVSKPAELGRISDADLDEARLQILVELSGAQKSEHVQKVWDREKSNSLLLGLGCYDEDEEEEQVAAMQAALKEVQEAIISSAEKGNKLEKKLNLHHGGYKNRAEMLRKKIGEASEALNKANNALGAFEMLSVSEEVAVRRRLEALREEVGYVSRREREAQELYRRIREESDVVPQAAAVANGYY
ncbi:hypothetical protein RB596_008356 [Gaeumannomyces avenae]